jgi:hypothetical protein
MTHTFNRLAVVAGMVVLGWTAGAHATHATTYTGTHVRIVAQNETFYDDTVYVSSDGCTVTDDASVVHELTGANALCALDAAASQGGFDYSVSYYDSLST